jgi:hypothetical protein
VGKAISSAPRLKWLDVIDPRGDDDHLRVSVDHINLGAIDHLAGVVVHLVRVERSSFLDVNE